MEATRSKLMTTCFNFKLALDGAVALSPAAYSLIGLGLGPTLVATLTQDVFQDKNAVHLSLLVAGVFAQVCAAVLLWRGLKHYRRSLDYLSAWSKTNA